MRRINITTASGSTLDKPFVTAFDNGNGKFVVFDNEANGTMGLPIILVSKLDNEKLVPINDTEWVTVKETLRQVIAGNQVDYVRVLDNLTADDAFYKQLTLPVQSFDVLKNSYKEPDSDAGMQIEQPISSVGPMDAPQDITPIEATPEPVSVDVTPVEQAQTSQITPEVAPTNQEVATVLGSQDIAPMPEVTPIPDEVEEPEVPVDFTADKEAFLKACENMFDALVAKFKK